MRHTRSAAVFPIFLAFGLISASSGTLLAHPPDHQESPDGDPTSRKTEIQTVPPTLVEGRAPAPETPPLSSATVTLVPIDARLPASLSLAQVLETTASTTVVRAGGVGDYSALSIRGSTFRQVQICLDGVPLNPDGSSAINLAELPIQAFSQLEVYRAGAPLSLSGAPMGGVVNLLTPQHYASTGTGSITVGSFDTLQASSHLYVPIKGGLATTSDLTLIADVLSTQGDFAYFADNGTVYSWMDDHHEVRQNNDKQQLSIFARGRVQEGPWRLTVLEAFLARDEGLPGHANAPTPLSRLNTRRLLSIGTIERSFDALTVQGRITAHQRLEALFDARFSEAAETEAVLQHRDQYFSLGLDLSAVALFSGSTRLEGALHLRTDRFLSYVLEEITATAPPHRESLELALAPTFWRRGGRLEVIPTLQLNAYETLASLAPLEDSATRGGFQGVFAPRFATSFQLLPDVTLRATSSRTFRPPSLEELYGNRGYVSGNDSLVPESAWQVDLGSTFAHGEKDWRYRLEVTGFYVRSSDLIAYVQNAQRVLVPINIGESRVRGLESSALFHIRWLDMSGSLTLSDSRDLSQESAYAGKRLPRLPFWEASSQVSVLVAGQARVGYGLRYVDAVSWDRTNFYWSPPHAEHTAFFRLRPSASPLVLEFSAQNLTDRTVEVVPQNPLEPEGPAVVQSATDFVGWPLPGRSFFMSLRWLTKEQE